MTTAEMERKIADLEAALAASKRTQTISMKVSDKGAMSLYGLGRFPVTLYASQWERVLGMSAEIGKFLLDHKHELAHKE